MHSPKSPAAYFPFLISLILILNSCNSGEVIDCPDKPYFGQDPPGMEAELFAPGIMSTGLFELNAAFFSGGDSVIYSAAVIPLGSMDWRMVMVKRTKKGWSRPETVAFNGEYSAVDPFVTSDGKRIYYCSNRPPDGDGEAEKDFDIWYVEITDKGWSEPVNPGEPINSSENEFYPSLTREGVLYFQSWRDRAKSQADIYSSVQENGQFRLVSKLPAPVNSDSFEGDALIAPDESFIIQTRNYQGSIGGTDLTVSFKQTDGTWGPVLNMGKGVNSSFNENCPLLSPDGKYLFFTSRRKAEADASGKLSYKDIEKAWNQPGNGLGGDIYWIDAGIIDSIKSHPDIFDPNTIKVTYVANEGFLIDTGEHKILTDALFGGIEGNWCDQPGNDLINRMVQGIPPFDNIDAILVSHHHRDHFDPEITIDFLYNHKESRLICTSQVLDILKKTEGFSDIAGRVSSPGHKKDGGSVFNIKGMKVWTMVSDHSAYMETDPATGKSRNRHEEVENLMFLVESGGRHILHTGDGSCENKEAYVEFGLSDTDIDLAFMDRMFMQKEGQQILNEIIKPEKVVFMHISPDRLDYLQSLVKDIPSMIIFSEKMQVLSL